MKQFKLLKDLPDLKAGAIFKWYLNNGIADLYSCGRYEYTEGFIKSKKDWFEEVNTVEKGYQDLIEKCKNSPYFFATNYLTINGKPFSTMLSEEEFNKQFLSLSNPEPSSKKEEGWEILSVIGKSTGFIYKKRQGEFFYKEGYLDIKLSQVLDGNVVSGCEIHSVLRKSDNTVFTVGDEVGYKINDTKFIVKTIKISGEPYLLDGDTFHKHLLPLRNATKAPTNTVEDKPLFSMKDIESCYEVAGKLYSPLYCDFYNALKELARSKTNNQ
jgi:hypothetical protein